MEGGSPPQAPPTSSASEVTNVVTSVSKIETIVRTDTSHLPRGTSSPGRLVGVCMEGLRPSPTSPNVTDQCCSPVHSPSGRRGDYIPPNPLHCTAFGLVCCLLRGLRPCCSTPNVPQSPQTAHITWFSFLESLHMGLIGSIVVHWGAVLYGAYGPAPRPSAGWPSAKGSFLR